jgi:hypothetical protein
MKSYALNESKMFADITDNIAIVINSETGIYYGMNEFGTAVFENIIKGVADEKILEAIKALPGAPDDVEERFGAFVKALVGSELIMEGGNADEGAEINADLAAKDRFTLDVREYNDAQELLLADPIHEVKEETGWAPDKDALETDEDAVKEKESKMEQ